MSLRAGSIDEAGFINNFGRSGYTDKQCCGELISNGIDAKATKYIIYINNDGVYFIDNGTGMTRDNLAAMFAMYKSNHEGKETMGVSGIGGKAASYNLSRQKICMISTNGYKALIPWDEMVLKGKYIDQIKINQMSINEIENCKKMFSRVDIDPESSGTIIQFPLNYELINSVDSYFNDKTHNEVSEQPSIIFGKFKNVTIKLINDIGKKEMILAKYDYFSPTHNFLNSVSETSIHAYYNKERGTIQFYEENRQYGINGESVTYTYFNKTAKSCKTKPQFIYIEEEFTDRVQYIDFIGSYLVHTGMIDNDRIFDRQQPDKYADSNKTKINGYSTNSAKIDSFPDIDIDTFGSKEAPCNLLKKVIVYRNRQAITSVSVPGSNNARANKDSCLRYIHIRQTVNSYTKSSQRNKMDIIMGIESNKNHHNGFFKDIQITRLLTYRRQEKAKELTAYMKQCYEKFIILNPSPPPLPVIPDPFPSPPDPVIPDPSPSPPVPIIPDPSPSPPVPIIPDPIIPDPIIPDPIIPDPTPPLPSEPEIRGQQLIDMVKSKIHPNEYYTGNIVQIYNSLCNLPHRMCEQPPCPR